MLVRLYLRLSFFCWGFFFCLSDWIYMRIFIFVVLRLDERSAWQTTSVKSVRRGRAFSSVVQLSFLCGTTSMAKKKKKEKKSNENNGSSCKLSPSSQGRDPWSYRLPQSLSRDLLDVGCSVLWTERDLTCWCSQCFSVFDLRLVFIRGRIPLRVICFTRLFQQPWCSQWIYNCFGRVDFHRFYLFPVSL